MTTAEIDKTLQASYTQAIASREQAAILAAMRESAEIELFPQNLQ